MRIVNVASALAILAVSLILALLLSEMGWVLILSFLILLDMVVSSLLTAIFLLYGKGAQRYKEEMLPEIEKRLLEPSTPELRVAALIPVFNEDPRLVAETASSADQSVSGLGDVYVLDDSTDPQIRKGIDEFSKIVGYKIFRRNSRRGYKAGALNDWLKHYGDEYDLLLVLDADQRPVPTLFYHALDYFKDESVAYVQIPQYYSNVRTKVGLAAYIQQIPFLRIVMRARHFKGSAFSLGSGTIFRISYLKEIGGFYELTVTEDVFTSLLLNEKGYRGVYLDVPLIWYGLPPENINSYWIQQGRWSLGGFQLIPRLLKSNIQFSRFLDYLAGILFWFHVGPLLLADIAAPAVFLLLNIPYLKIDPLLYTIVYVPLFLLSMAYFLKIVSIYGYGLREFLFHQSAHVLISIPITGSFISALLKRRITFRTTPKTKEGDEGKLLYPLAIFITLSLILAISILRGFRTMLITSSEIIFWSTFVNVFWAAWWLLFTVMSIYIMLPGEARKETISKIKQSYELLEPILAIVIRCSSALEGAIGNYYLLLSKKVGGKIRKILEELGVDSLKHEGIYRKIANIVRIGSSPSLSIDEIFLCRLHSDLVARIAELRNKCPSDEDIGMCLLPEEEVHMLVMASMVKEMLSGILDEEILSRLDEIIEDERKHEKMVREIIGL